MTTQTELPRWDMTPVYPSLESPEFAAGFQKFLTDLSAIEQLFDIEQIGFQEPIDLKDDTIATFERVISEVNAISEFAATLAAYIGAFVTTNTRDTVAQARDSEFEQNNVRLSKLSTRLTAWIGSLDVEGLIERSDVARDHAFVLRQAKVAATHLMSPVEETLASDMNLTGAHAWSKLHGDITSQIMVPIELDGKAQEIPMTAIRNLAHNKDREVRRAGYEAELAAWKRVEVPIAASLNSIKGQVNTLSKRRKWDSPLDKALFENHMDRQTLDAMMTAAGESFPDFRRYLHAKARAVGVERLAWFDLFAPVGGSTQVWAWDDATQFIIDQFGTYSDRMSNFAARAFREQWVDAGPRPGKVSGAFCMGLRKDESRILSNFEPSFDGVSTLAHELGHAYHNLNLASRTPLQQDTPMTLAETASIFCETIIREAALKTSGPVEQIAILEASLQGTCQVVVDIASRWMFEQAVFEARVPRELSADEFCAAMLEAQEATYGNGLDPTLRHPYMWAVKGHYYSTYSFYNYPYMFGMLFGLGLYARYQASPEEFKESYDDLLSSTGLADAATLANRFGIDIQTPDFWRSSFDIIRADITKFEGLV